MKNTEFYIIQNSTFTHSTLIIVCKLAQTNGLCKFRWYFRLSCVLNKQNLNASVFIKWNQKTESFIWLLTVKRS